MGHELMLFWSADIVNYKISGNSTLSWLRSLLNEPILLPYLTIFLEYRNIIKIIRITNLSHVDGQKTRAPLFPTDYNPAIRHSLACLLHKPQVFTVNIDVLVVTGFFITFLPPKVWNQGGLVTYMPSKRTSRHWYKRRTGPEVQLQY